MRIQTEFSGSRASGMIADRSLRYKLDIYSKQITSTVLQFLKPMKMNNEILPMLLTEL